MSADGEKFSALLVLFPNANNGRNDEQFYKNKKEKKNCSFMDEYTRPLICVSYKIHQT